MGKKYSIFAGTILNTSNIPHGWGSFEDAFDKNTHTRIPNTVCF